MDRITCAIYTMFTWKERLKCHGGYDSRKPGSVSASTEMWCFHCDF